VYSLGCKMGGRAVEVAEYPGIVEVHDVQSLNKAPLSKSRICRGREVDVNGR
jgi:hypothetical protein